jgi:hypothetical protein
MHALVSVTSMTLVTEPFWFQATNFANSRPCLRDVYIRLFVPLPSYDDINIGTGNRGITASEVNGYGLDDVDSITNKNRGCYVRPLFQTGFAVHPVSLPVSASGLFPGVKWPKSQAHRSPSCISEVCNTWNVVVHVYGRDHVSELHPSKGLLFIPHMIYEG